MPEPRTPAVPASGVVHWIGTGLSTGTGLTVLAGLAPSVLVWGRSEGRAEACIERLGLTGRVTPRVFSPQALAAVLGPGDVVISMLPATEHLALLELCLSAQAHFACSSYVSEAMLAAVPSAEQAGLVVLTEAGLDPGLDHALAHLLVAQAREAIGDAAESADFTSYCGGVPAEPNDFRYRFSWAPRGVLTALLSPSRYIEHGEIVRSERPWTATRPYPVGTETFEAYPNRDSIPFVAQYELPTGWQLETFVRGTLRLAGWHQAWQPVFAELPDASPDRITELAAELAERYPTTDADRDRVVLAVALAARAPDGRSWRGEYLLDLTGSREHSAMAQCVSLPLAFGVSEILTGRTGAGLHRAAETANEARRWLAFLAGHGIEIGFTASTVPATEVPV